MRMPDRELDEGTRLVAKDGCWFPAGSLVTVVADCRAFGVVLSGLKDGVEDEETCPWDDVEYLQ